MVPMCTVYKDLPVWQYRHHFLYMSDFNQRPSLLGVLSQLSCLCSTVVIWPFNRFQCYQNLYVFCEYRKLTLHSMYSMNIVPHGLCVLPTFQGNKFYSCLTDCSPARLIMTVSALRSGGWNLELGGGCNLGKF